MLTDPQPHYASTKEAAIKLAGKPAYDMSNCLLVTPHMHEGKLWHRRAISGMKVIYNDPMPCAYSATLGAETNKT
jgi:hypothetical protein